MGATLVTLQNKTIDDGYDISRTAARNPQTTGDWMSTAVAHLEGVVSLNADCSAEQQNLSWLKSGFIHWPTVSETADLSHCRFCCQTARSEEKQTSPPPPTHHPKKSNNTQPATHPKNKKATNSNKQNKNSIKLNNWDWFFCWFFKFILWEGKGVRMWMCTTTKNLLLGEEGVGVGGRVGGGGGGVGSKTEGCDSLCECLFW